MMRKFLPLFTALFMVAAVTVATPSTAATPVTKVLVFVEENHSLAQMQVGMPYTYGLAKTYGYATNWTGVSHPSLPNYLAMVFGDTFGVANDGSPKAHPIAAQTVFGQALGSGHTARTYAETMTSNCQLTKANPYVTKHNPWLYSTTERTQCGQGDVPVTRLTGDITAGNLPNVGMVIPNQDNDAHDGTLQTADDWFKACMVKIFAGPDWLSGRLAVIVTGDESTGLAPSGNTVLTVVIHGSQSHRVVTTALNHYSLTRFYEDVISAAYLRKAGTATSMSTAFGIPTGS